MGTPSWVCLLGRIRHLVPADTARFAVSRGFSPWLYMYGWSPFRCLSVRLCAFLCFSLTSTICCVPSATYTTISCIRICVSISLHYILYLYLLLLLYLVSSNSPRRPSCLSCAYVRILPYILSYSYILCLCLRLTTASCSTTISCTIYSQYPISRPTTSPVHTAISSSVRLLLLHRRLLHNPLSRPSQRLLCVLFGSL